MIASIFALAKPQRAGTTEIITYQSSSLWKNGFVTCVATHIMEKRLLKYAHNAALQNLNFIVKGKATDMHTAYCSYSSLF